MPLSQSATMSICSGSRCESFVTILPASLSTISNDDFSDLFDEGIHCLSHLPRNRQTHHQNSSVKGTVMGDFFVFLQHVANTAVAISSNQ